MYLKVHCHDFCYIGNQLYIDRMTGNIKYHSDLHIFYVIKKIAMFLFRKQSIRLSIRGIATSIKIMIIILTEIYQL